MERFWTLQYLRQNGITELEASVFKDNMVRADTLPLVLPVMGGQNLPRGARVRVKLGDMDLITLDITGTVVERLDTPTMSTLEADAIDEEDDGEDVSGPIAIAVDVNEPSEAPSDNPAP
jgi:exoribonuclease-2